MYMQILIQWILGGNRDTVLSNKLPMLDANADGLWTTLHSKELEDSLDSKKWGLL